MPAFSSRCDRNYRGFCRRTIEWAGRWLNFGNTCIWDSHDLHSCSGLPSDLFDFNAIAESVKGINRDVITDFDRSLDDLIDLTDIDAKKGVGGNNAFKFIGAKAFHDVKGELRCSDGIVKGDVNGDGVADFEIQVNLVTLKGGDFLL